MGQGMERLQPAPNVGQDWGCWSPSHKILTGQNNPALIIFFSSSICKGLWLPLPCLHDIIPARSAVLRLGLFVWTTLIFPFSKLLIFLNSFKHEAKLDALFPFSMALAQQRYVKAVSGQFCNSKKFGSEILGNKA